MPVSGEPPLHAADVPLEDAPIKTVEPGGRGSGSGAGRERVRERGGERERERESERERGIRAGHWHMVTTILQCAARKHIQATTHFNRG